MDSQLSIISIAIFVVIIGLGILMRYLTNIDDEQVVTTDTKTGIEEDVPINNKPKDDKTKETNHFSKLGVKTPEQSTDTNNTTAKSQNRKSAIIAIIIVILVFGCLFYQFNWEDIQQSKYTGITNDSEYITKIEFDAIRTGMTYSKVISIIGSSGELTSSSSYSGCEIEIYTWWGKGSLGANAMITFENGKVTSKAQVGLQ